MGSRLVSAPAASVAQFGGAFEDVASEFGVAHDATGRHLYRANAVQFGASYVDHRAGYGVLRGILCTLLLGARVVHISRNAEVIRFGPGEAVSGSRYFGDGQHDCIGKLHSAPEIV